MPPSFFWDKNYDDQPPVRSRGEYGAPKPSAPPAEEEEIYIPPKASKKSKHSSSKNTTFAPEETQEHEEFNREDFEQQLKAASGVVVAFIGYLVGGPLPGLLAGFAGSHASKQQGALADIVRSFGELLLIILDKASKYDDKHQVYPKIIKVAGYMWQKGREYDQKYDLMEKGRYYALLSLNKVYNFVIENRLLEHGSDNVGGAIFTVLNKVMSVIPNVDTEGDYNSQKKSRKGGRKQPPPRQNDDLSMLRNLFKYKPQ